MHHNAGLFNGIWSDMAIETTFMRYDHGQGEIIGITLKPEILKTWAYSLHTYHGIIDDLNEMRDNERLSAQTSHKEETWAYSLHTCRMNDYLPKLRTKKKPGLTACIPAV